MLQLLQKGVGVVNVEESQAAVGLVVAEGELLLTPLLLHLKEPLLQLQLTLGTMKNVLDGCSMTADNMQRIMMSILESC